MLSRLGTSHLLATTGLLIAVGPFLVYSASAARSELTFESSTVYLVRQLEGLLVGGLAALLLSRASPVLLRRTGILMWAGTVALLAATLTPLGIEQHGSRRWLQLGPMVVQPLELMKLGLILGLAQWLSGNGERLRDLRFGVGVPLLIGVGIPALLLLMQPDFGGALLLTLFAVTLTFAAGVRMSHLAASAVVGLPIAAWLALGESYRLGRIHSFLDPFADPSGQGYQLIQSFLAFGAGGLFGTGLGAGRQKLGFLPEAHTDFILSVIGEELGLVGVTLILTTLAMFGLATLAIASRARDRYGLLLATGAGLLIWLQGLVNAAVATGILPTTGTTLPLVSYGRSSLVTSLAAVGLILNVARPARRGRRGWR
ncbi:MAG: putative peptidoglycan glycosyltransferase FtsW [Myxococcota bacterium]